MEQQIDDFINNEIQPATLSLLYLPLDKNTHGEKKIRRLANSSLQHYCISPASALLPFLTIEENFFVGIKQKKTTAYSSQFEHWKQLFKLDQEINHAYPKSISQETQVIIHLIRAFILEKELIFIDDLELNLSPTFLAGLIPVLKKISREREIAIVLLTEKNELAETFSLPLISVS